MCMCSMKAASSPRARRRRCSATPASSRPISAMARRSAWRSGDMLEVRGLAAGYGALPVLRGIDLAIAAGEIVAVLGSNGAGKTTLNSVLSGLLKPTSGGIRFADAEIAGAAPRRIVALGLIHVPEGR